MHHATIDLEIGDNQTFLRVKHGGHSREQRKEESCVEIDNNLFFFLIKNNVCINDENSIYDSQSNKMLLIGRNGRQLENGVMIGRLLHGLRKQAAQPPVVNQAARSQARHSPPPADGNPGQA